MFTQQHAWESFLETGKIDDYLHYCQARKRELYSQAGKGAETDYATENQWDRPARFQNQRG